MAEEAESGGERTEEPSQRRLDQARERGQVPRSRELTNFATMVGGSATLIAVGSSMAGRMSLILRNSLSFDPHRLEDPLSMPAFMGEAITSGLMGLLPIFGASIALVLLASVVLGGWNFSPVALVPDFTRMSPLSGIKRLFGLHGLTELGKALLKCVVVGGVCAGVVSWLFRDVMSLGRMEITGAIGHGVALVGRAFVWLCSSLAVIAAVDVPLQMLEFKRNLRMTRQELRDEAKESDGRPEVKGRIRQMQQQMARRRMMHKIPTADVVLVNPTHFAVALKYDPKKMRAPRLVAKGSDVVAANIRRIAEEHRVPIFESPKLARALFKSTDLNEEIPAGLYVAVAQVLSYIFRLRTLNPTLAARMVRPDPKLGEEFADA
jgi:flagellar biosynthesis protein FlhB